MNTYNNKNLFICANMMLYIDHMFELFVCRTYCSVCDKQTIRRLHSVVDVTHAHTIWPVPYMCEQ